MHDDGHYQRRSQGLADEVQRSGWQVFACCWMPNLHVLLRTPESNLEPTLPVVATSHQVTPEEYVGFRSAATGRERAALLCRRWTGVSLAELARRFGLRHPDRSANLARRAKQREANSAADRCQIRQAESLWTSKKAKNKSDPCEATVAASPCHSDATAAAKSSKAASNSSLTIDVRVARGAVQRSRRRGLPNQSVTVRTPSSTGRSSPQISASTDRLGTLGCAGTLFPTTLADRTSMSVFPAEFCGGAARPLPDGVGSNTSLAAIAGAAIDAAAADSPADVSQE